ncbi:MAG: TonB-dependent receptor plug domain-containing protein, partial [Thermaurantiacus sp.]
SDEDSGAIVVTARRAEERLQDVPIAVSALAGADLARQQLDDLSDIAEKTVGFAFENFTGITVQPVIRGQTNLRIDSPVLNVAFYLDGVYLQRGYFVDQSLLELDRVEIIKGPQSALYGRNAFAGAVNMVSRRPDLDDWFVKVGGTVGNYDRYDWRAAFNLPILPDRLAVFFNYAHSEFDGSWKNNHPLANERGATTRGRLGGWDKDTYQARVLIKPT